jgi:hypothetical protein
MRAVKILKKSLEMRLSLFGLLFKIKVKKVEFNKFIQKFGGWH